MSTLKINFVWHTILFLYSVGTTDSGEWVNEKSHFIIGYIFPGDFTGMTRGNPDHNFRNPHERSAINYVPPTADTEVDSDNHALFCQTRPNHTCYLL